MATELPPSIPNTPESEPPVDAPDRPSPARSGSTAATRIWWQGFLDRVVSRESYLFIIVVLGMLFVYYFANKGSSPSQGIGTVEYARGLITLTFCVGVMIIAVVLILTAVLRDPDDNQARAEERFNRAKEVLTLLIGVFGTIIGFYFGTLSDQRQALPAVGLIAGLGGAIRGDTAFLTGPSFTDENIELIRETPGISRVYLDSTRVTAKRVGEVKGPARPKGN